MSAEIFYMMIFSRGDGGDPLRLKGHKRHKE